MESKSLKAFRNVLGLILPGLIFESLIMEQLGYRHLDYGLTPESLIIVPSRLMRGQANGADRCHGFKHVSS